MNNPLGVSPSKGKQGTTRGKEKIFLTSVGTEPTTSGLDPPYMPTDSLMLCRVARMGGDYNASSGLGQNPAGGTSGFDEIDGGSSPEVVGSVRFGSVRSWVRSWVRFPGQIFSLPRVVPCFPLLGLTVGYSWV